MTDVGPARDARSHLDFIYDPIRSEMGRLDEYLRGEFHSQEPFVHELLMHIARFKGKQIRPACLMLAAKVFGDVTDDHIKSAGVVELIHTATLVHDDLLDDSVMRRRVETVNKRWGERAAVLLGDFIYSRGFSISTEVPGVSRLLADTTHTICEGELLQVGSAFDTNLTEERYSEIIRKKTAVLYGMSCRVGAMLSGAGTDEQATFHDFGERLGMAFQIADDTLDITGDEQVVGKSLGTDLAKGKMTLPLLRLRERLGRGKLDEFHWLLRNPEEIGSHQRVVNLLAEHDVMEEVKAAATGYVDGAVRLLDDLPASPLRENFQALAHFILERDL